MNAFREATRRVVEGADPRVEAETIVAAMKLEEKLACLDGDTDFWPGLADMGSGGYRHHSWPGAKCERLGVPGIDFADGPRGCVVGNATCFPVAMARGATWDPDLEERIGEAIGRELRASGATFTGAVCMNLLRHPGWGRAQETYGEDPHHVGEMAAAATRGLQRHVLACMKHFALNSIENARFRVDVTADERALHEVYLPHFRRVAEAGVASVMSAYNSVNGEWCGENQALLTTILRDEWGFQGFVISDFIFGLRDPVKSVKAGLNVEMPFRQQRHRALRTALEAGELREADVDRRVGEIVATLLRFAFVFERRPAPEVIACNAHRALAHEAAVRSMVLLRNEGVLPVAPATVRRVAVLGRLAAVPNLGDGGSSNVHPPTVVTPLEGIRAALPDAEVVQSESDVAIADGADLVVVVVGFTRKDEGEYLGDPAANDLLPLFPPMEDVHPATEPAPRPATSGPTFTWGGDRRSLRLPHEHEELIAAALARSDRVVVAVMGGSATLMPWLDRAAAVLQLWYPGMEGGHALADVLFGRSEPGGRLPFVIPADEAHLPEFDPDATAITYGLFHGQWLLDRNGHAAQRPFGFGLGYTTFSLSDARLRPIAGGGVVSVRVVNTGERDGSTVVQVYGGLPDSKLARPARRLVGFRRLALAAGAANTIEIAFRLDTLAVRDGGKWRIEPGAYRFTVGQHAGDAGATVDLTVE